MNHSNLTRWLVICALLLLIGVIAGYQFAPTEKRPTQYVPIQLPPPPLDAPINQYLITHYGSLDRNSRVVVSYQLEDCMGVLCGVWGVKPHAESLTAYIRCYLETGVCVPTFEEFQVQPNAGNYPTLTPYAEPTSIKTEHGIGEPAS